MLTSEQMAELIEQHFAGSLSEESQQMFDKLMQKNTAFRQEVELYELLTNGAKTVGREQVLEQLKATESSITKEAQSGVKWLEKLNDAAQYSLEQLTAFFAPVPNYQAALAYTTRAESIEVISPINGMDCNNGLLDFELEEEPDDDIKVVIENNQHETILTQHINDDITSFTILLPEQLVPGRYYWKLITEDELVIGEFFIGKALKPAE